MNIKRLLMLCGALVFGVLNAQAVEDYPESYSDSSVGDSDQRVEVLKSISRTVIKPLLGSKEISVYDLKFETNEILSKYNLSSLNEVFVRPGYTYFDRIIDVLATLGEPAWSRKTSTVVRILMDEFGCKPTPGAVPNAEKIIQDARDGKYDGKTADQARRHEILARKISQDGDQTLEPDYKYVAPGYLHDEPDSMDE